MKETAMMIDMHAHWRPAEVADALRARTREPRILRNPDGVEVLKAGRMGEAPLAEAFDDVDFHLARMDRQGVEVSVLSLLGSFCWIEAQPLDVSGQFRSEQRNGDIAGADSGEETDDVVDALWGEYRYAVTGPTELLQPGTDRTHPGSELGPGQFNGDSALPAAVVQIAVRHTVSELRDIAVETRHQRDALGQRDVARAVEVILDRQFRGMTMNKGIPTHQTNVLDRLRVRWTQLCGSGHGQVHG